MGNFEYLIAGLPDISLDWKGQEGKSWESLLAEIRQNCSEKDNRLIDILVDGYNDDMLDSGFYRKALAGKDSFLREYFRFDLHVRNAKVRYLNRALGRAAETDIFMEAPGEFAEAQRLEAVLNGSDLIARERGIDELMWNKITELTVFNYFDIDAVLGFIARLHIVYRWLKLDAETGRQMFARLVSEIRGSYTGVHAAAEAAVK